MANIKIEKLETFVAVNWMMVRITTDNGIQGIGESTFFGWPGAAENVALSFEPYLIGQDPLRAEHHWNYMYRAKSMRGGAIGGGISAIDQALWDIKGKYFEAPVWQLLGGKARDAVRAMLVLPTGTLEEVANAAAAAKADGFTAVKCLLYQHDHAPMRHSERIQDLVDRTAAVRDAVGWDMDVGIEIHRNMIPGEAIVLAQEIEKFRPYFFEDPVAPDSHTLIRRSVREDSHPDGRGMRILTIGSFRELHRAAVCIHVRPDMCCRGLHALQKDLRDRRVAPSRHHSSRGSIRPGGNGGTRSARGVCSELRGAGARLRGELAVLGCRKRDHQAGIRLASNPRGPWYRRRTR